MSVLQRYNTHTAGLLLDSKTMWNHRCPHREYPFGVTHRSRRIRMTLNLFHTCHPKESILETGTLEVFLAWRLHADGGGVGVVSERDLELLMDAEGGTAREMGMFPPFSLMPSS